MLGDAVALEPPDVDRQGHRAAGQAGDEAVRPDEVAVFGEPLHLEVKPRKALARPPEALDDGAAAPAPFAGVVVDEVFGQEPGPLFEALLVVKEAVKLDDRGFACRA